MTELKTAHVTDITVPSDRIRTTLSTEKLQDLKISVGKIGLLHPIVINEGNEEDKMLVAGFRRLTAIAELYKEDSTFLLRCAGIPIFTGHIPYVYYEDLTKTERREIELEENVQRLDLTWQERCDGIAELDKFKRETRTGTDERTTVEEIVLKTGKSVAAVQVEISRSNIVANVLHKDDIKNSRSLTEAYNKAIRDQQSFLATHLPKSKKKHVCLHGDCTELELPENLFTCVIADPPYGEIDADKFGDAAKLSHGYIDETKHTELLITSFLGRLDTITTNKAHLFLFCDPIAFSRLKGQVVSMTNNSEWDVWRTPLIWHKPGPGHAPKPGLGPRRQYECILYANKNNKATKTVFGDVLSYPPAQDKAHAAQKPVDLYSFLIHQSCIPGDHILDPFCGSGTIFHSARDTKTVAYGIEKDEEFFKLSEAKAKGAL